LSKNNKFLCTGGENGEVRVWEIRSLEMISNLKEHKSRVSKVELMENDLHLLTTAKDRSILIWDLAKEQRIANYQMPMGGVNNFILNKQDKNMLITVGQDRRITQWDLRHPKPVKSISSNPYNRSDAADELFALDISNSNKYLVTGGTNGLIRCYDLSTLGFLNEVNAHSGVCTNIMFTNDDKYLISSGSDSQILTYSVV
jgi:WD40 repeat protein